MHFDKLDLNLIVVLDALIEAKSVSGAARRLHLTQPTVSGSLSRLRRYFEDDLLVQSGRTMLLTTKAKELADPVRRILVQIRSDITRPSGFDPSISDRRFSIAASDYSIEVLLADVMAEVEENAPSISFDIFLADEASQKRLLNADLDLLVTVTPFLMDGHPHMPLFDDEDVVISWTGAGYDQMDQETFFTAGHVSAYFGANQPALAEEHMLRLPEQRRIEVRVPSFAMLPLAVVGTRRIATMHGRHARRLAQLYPIAIHPAPIPLPPIQEVVQWHRLREGDKGLIWLLDRLKTRAAALT